MQNLSLPRTTQKLETQTHLVPVENPDFHYMHTGAHTPFMPCLIAPLLHGKGWNIHSCLFSIFVQRRNETLCSQCLLTSFLVCVCGCVERVSVGVARVRRWRWCLKSEKEEKWVEIMGSWVWIKCWHSAVLSAQKYTITLSLSPTFSSVWQNTLALLG